ncbi:hypothetical protein ACS0TY_001846 [Phlomoides rotata]
MACLKTPKDDQNQAFYNSIMSPRISFSNDFGDLQLPINLENSYKEAPVSSDFAFSVPNYATISADELFFNGKMIPSNTKKTTLGDELLAGDDGILSSKMGKGTSWWKQRLGLKRSQGVVPKKGERNIGGLEKIDEMKTSGMVFER